MYVKVSYVECRIADEGWFTIPGTIAADNVMPLDEDDEYSTNSGLVGLRHVYWWLRKCADKFGKDNVRLGHREIHHEVLRDLIAKDGQGV